MCVWVRRRCHGSGSGIAASELRERGSTHLHGSFGEHWAYLPLGQVAVLARRFGGSERVLLLLKESLARCRRLQMRGVPGSAQAP